MQQDTLEVEAIEILVIEDNPDDLRLTLEGLRDPAVPYNVQSVSDGEEALKILRKERPYAHVPRPRLILLDLNLPRLDGRKLLANIKADPELSDIPVVVLSGSRRTADIENAYSQGAALYITKPADLKKYFASIRALKDLFFGIGAPSSGSSDSEGQTK